MANNFRLKINLILIIVLIKPYTMYELPAIVFYGNKKRIFGVIIAPLLIFEQFFSLIYLLTPNS